MKVFISMSKTHSSATVLFGSAFFFKVILLRMPQRYNKKVYQEEKKNQEKQGKPNKSCSKTKHISLTRHD